MSYPYTHSNAYNENCAPSQYYSPQPPVPISKYSSLAGALEAPSPPQKPQEPSLTTPRSTGSQNVLHNVQPSSSRRRTANPIPEPGAYYSTFSAVPPPPVQHVERPACPSNHVKLPQPHVPPPRNSSSGFHQPISFQLCDFAEAGVRLADTRGANPVIRGAKDQVWAGYVERQIEVHIIWPGYSKYPFQKRLKLGPQGGHQTRNELLTILSSLVMECVESIKKHRIPVEPGYEMYAIGKKPDGSKGLEGHQCFLTALVHRGGISWQPEIFIPRYPHLAV